MQLRLQSCISYTHTMRIRTTHVGMFQSLGIQTKNAVGMCMNTHILQWHPLFGSNLQIYVTDWKTNMAWNMRCYVVLTIETFHVWVSCSSGSSRVTLKRWCCISPPVLLLIAIWNGSSPDLVDECPPLQPLDAGVVNPNSSRLQT